MKTSVFGHLKVVLTHKRFVFEGCRKCGIMWLGLIHDTSKFSPVEFGAAVRYFDGHVSPIQVERSRRGHSDAWLHHKSHNKHHWEYWVDYLPNGEERYIRMPEKYTKEMLCDWVAAGKAYNGKKWTHKHPLRYFSDHRDYYHLHPETEKIALDFLEIFDQKGEAAAFEMLRSFHYIDQELP